MWNTRWITVYDWFEDEKSLFRSKVSIKDSVSCGTSINKLKQGSSSSNLKRQYKSVELKDTEIK